MFEVGVDRLTLHLFGNISPDVSGLRAVRQPHLSESCQLIKFDDYCSYATSLSSNLETNTTPTHRKSYVDDKYKDHSHPRDCCDYNGGKLQSRLRRLRKLERK